MPRHFLLRVGVSWLSLLTGCIGERQYTIVEKHVTPDSFKFVTLVDTKGRDAGGWRVPCLHLMLQHDMGASYVCKVGVEILLKRGREGTLHVTNCLNQPQFVAP